MISGGTYRRTMHRLFAIRFELNPASAKKSRSMKEATVNHEQSTAPDEQARTANFIRRNIFVVAFCTLFLMSGFFLASCGGQTASGQHATILMRDGSTLSGTVTSTSASEITLTADDTTKHTIPMAQVKSIEYDDAPTQTSAAQPSSGDTAGTGASGGSSASGGAAAPRRRSAAAKAKE